jgi:hypothetical protein
MKVFKAPVIIALFLFAQNSYGQCCSAGNPVGGNGINDALQQRELMFLTTYKHSLSKDYFHKDHKTEVPLIDRSYYDYQNISVSYGVLKWLNIGSEIGYFYNKTQILKSGQMSDEIRAHGLGDLGINFRFLPFQSLRPASQFSISGGLRIPVGAFDEQIDGVTVPVSLQPSSGALKVNASLYYSVSSANRKFSVNSFALYEYSNTIEKGYFIYKYGDFLQLSSGLQYFLNNHFTFLLNLKYEWRGKDQRENNEVVASSGSHLILINPQVTCNINHGWSVMMLSDVPLYKYVYGEQLSSSYAIQIALFKIIKVRKGNSSL